MPVPIAGVRGGGGDRRAGVLGNGISLGDGNLVRVLFPLPSTATLAGDAERLVSVVTTRALDNARVSALVRSPPRAVLIRPDEILPLP